MGKKRVPLVWASVFPAASAAAREPVALARYFAPAVGLTVQLQEQEQEQDHYEAECLSIVFPDPVPAAAVMQD
ncbi:hypothetical protein ACFQI7_27270 [Paenibacillus allorhizosphaerae]|uniref:hypothetical protein n=1 Tax=Paenibacillus allorhizosphaerae TaxID=2849866 RepID=UPI001E49A05D|nr:hypothetical protein [Paenibacillus allorhizosphaerae]